MSVKWLPPNNQRNVCDEAYAIIDNRDKWLKSSVLDVEKVLINFCKPFCKPTERTL